MSSLASLDLLYALPGLPRLSGLPLPIRRYHVMRYAFSVIAFSITRYAFEPSAFAFQGLLAVFAHITFESSKVMMILCS